MNVDSIMRWERLGTPASGSLVEARRQLHWAVQIPAAVGNSWVEPEPEQAHLSLTWCEEARLAMSRETRTSPRFRAALHPEELALSFLGDDGTAVGTFSLVGRTVGDALSWLRGAAEAWLGRPVGAELLRPEHELPTHPAGQGAPFTAEHSAERAELTRWYANAERVLRGLSHKATHASSARLWPHHFDLAVLVRMDPAETGPEARSIGVGMTPGDGSYAEPYWYVSPWPYPEDRPLPELAGGGAWHTRGWTGAVLPGSALAGSSDPQEQAGQVLTFLHSAINASTSLLDVG